MLFLFAPCQMAYDYEVQDLNVHVVFLIYFKLDVVHYDQNLLSVFLTTVVILMLTNGIVSANN